MDDLISRQPETHEEHTETHACDCISREAAIHLIAGYNGVVDKSVAKRLLIQMPSAQPDEAKVLAEILDGCTLTYPCDKLWSPDGWCKDHCKDNYKEPSAECWLKYAEVVVSDSTDTR